MSKKSCKRKKEWGEEVGEGGDKHERWTEGLPPPKPTSVTVRNLPFPGGGAAVGSGLPFESP